MYGVSSYPIGLEVLVLREGPPHHSILEAWRVYAKVPIIAVVLLGDGILDCNAPLELLDGIIQTHVDVGRRLFRNYVIQR